MSALRRVQAILWVTILTGLAGTSWGLGPIHSTGEALPSNLITPLGLASRQVEIHNTYIGCYDIRNGNPLDCSFVMKINGPPTQGDPVENHGGHTHVTGPPRDYGELRLGGSSAGQVSGQTGNTQVLVEHLLPQVGGGIERQLDVFVPPGWFTARPEGFDASRSFWRFIHRLNVRVPGLSRLPVSSNCLPVEPPDPICKKRGVPTQPDDNHKDAFAFYGTGSTVLFLTAIGDNFRIETRHPLAVNDISLISGGYFDLDLNWRGARRHENHRNGNSADISKVLTGDCTQNLTLVAIVHELMPISSRSPLLNIPNPPTHKGTRVRCELNNDKNIHIDFDQIAPIVILGPF